MVKGDGMRSIAENIVKKATSDETYRQRLIDSPLEVILEEGVDDKMANEIASGILINDRASNGDHIYKTTCMSTAIVSRDLK
jgi:hypothetical protein